MLLVAPGALADVWAREQRRELLLERCPGCAGSGPVCHEALRFISCWYPSAWCCCCTALHARPGEEAVNELSLRRAFTSRLLLWEHKYFSK